MTPAPISVERLRELLAEATPGPWSQDHRRGKDGGYRTQVFDASGDEIATLAWHAKPPRYEDGRKIISTDRAENAELIVAMHEALPALLHQLAERDAEVERLRNEKNAMFIRARELAEQCGAAERAREESTGLLREALMGWDDLIEEMELNGMHDDPRFGYRKHKEWIGAVEAKASAAASGGG